jgi:hypothetical protein
VRLLAGERGLEVVAAARAPENAKGLGPGTSASYFTEPFSSMALDINTCLCPF